MKGVRRVTNAFTWTQGSDIEDTKASAPFCNMGVLFGALGVLMHTYFERVALLCMNHIDWYCKTGLPRVFSAARLR